MQRRALESATKAEGVVRLESLDLSALAARARDWAYLNGLVTHDTWGLENVRMAGVLLR